MVHKIKVKLVPGNPLFNCLTTQIIWLLKIF